MTLTTPCPICLLEVSNVSIRCSICSFHFHPKCAKIPHNQLRSKTAQYKNWFCHDCNIRTFPFNSLTNAEIEILHCPDISLLENDNFDFMTDTLPTARQLKESMSKITNPLVDKFDTNDPNSKLNSTCQYYYATEVQNQQTNGLSIIHFNARSLNANASKIEQFLLTCKTNFDVITITETWENEQNKRANFLNGYSCFQTNREASRGGGVSIFIKESLCSQLNESLSFGIENLCEIVTVQINSSSGEKTLISCVYRKPDGSINEFCAKIDNLIQALKNKNAYVCGDFNIDLLKYDTHAPTQHFTDLMMSTGFIPLITIPTRIRTHSQTLIDHIFTNVLKHEHAAGAFIADVSDHLPVFSQQLTNEHEISKPTFITKRKLDNESISNFKTSLINETWNQVLNTNDVNNAYNEFIRIFVTNFEKNCPLMKVKLNPRSINKPWFTKSLKDACANKNKLYFKFLKTKLPKDEDVYKKYKNKLTSILRYCEKKYYDDLFEKSKRDAKKTWNIINSLIRPSTKNKKKEYEEMLNENTKHKDIANGFNDFFTNIGPKLANKINTSNNTNIRDFLKNPQQQTMFLHPVDKSELVNTVKLIKSKTSLDYLGLNMRTIKDVFEEICDPLLYICNKSFVDGIFPDEMKTAKVIPLFKAGDKCSFSNYRPISLLPQFSKILEKLFTTRFDSFLDKYKIIHPSQYGFQTKKNTTTALMELVEEITDNFEQKKKVVGIFIDLQKAFDTVNHEILLTKLEHYGLRGTALNWITSYLNNRKQYVDIDGTKSDQSIIKCGVPQGSVLGPKLFLIYINDIGNVSDFLKFILFADDTTILCSHENIFRLIEILNIELEKLYHWFSANKLTLNIKKTNYILFNLNNRDSTTFNLKINGLEILQVSATKFLGITVDEKLTWKNHINNVLKKLSRASNIIFHTRKLINERTARTIYCSIYLPHLTYCAEIWGNTYMSNLTKIITSQKKAIRTIYNVPRLVRDGELPGHQLWSCGLHLHVER